MPLFEWDEELATGSSIIDRQHKQLIELVNRAYDMATEGAAAAEWSSMIRELVEYATYHFYFEECWMRELGYPELAEHKAEHERLTAEILRRQEALVGGELNAIKELVTFLLEWFVSHIMTSDGKCGRFAKEAERCAA